MSYLDREESGGTRLLKRAAMFFVGLVAFVIVKAIFSGGSDFVERQTYSGNKVDTTLINDPGGGKAYLEMKTRFPREYKQLTSNLSELVKNGAGKDEIWQASFRAMHTFTRNNLKHVVAASDESLVSIARSQSRIANVLSGESQSLCAQFGMSGLSESARPSASALAALAEGLRLLIIAADEGARSPSIRDLKQVSDADSEALGIALTQNGLSTRQVEMVGSSALATASDVDKCEITRGLYESVASMPAPTAARLTAFMLLPA